MELQGQGIENWGNKTEKWSSEKGGSGKKEIGNLLGITYYDRDVENINISDHCGRNISKTLGMDPE